MKSKQRHGVGALECGICTPFCREFEPSFVQVVDESDGCGSKLDAIIVSTKFEGVGLLARQRSVNECLSEEMPNIHAFTMKTWTPSQYEKKKASL
ncbi:Bola2 [Symbiodinium sp. KB8]|nr:Bola2 [Symbiodinium sp. KB8]